jgi:hypothetical protein
MVILAPPSGGVIWGSDIFLCSPDSMRRVRTLSGPPIIDAVGGGIILGLRSPDNGVGRLRCLVGNLEKEFATAPREIPVFAKREIGPVRIPFVSQIV